MAKCTATERMTNGWLKMDERLKKRITFEGGVIGEGSIFEEKIKEKFAFQNGPGLTTKNTIQNYP